MSFVRLARLFELTRSMPQTGYALSEIPKGELSDLAQHHYLVAAIAWQLARMAIREGATLDLGKVLEFALIHDLGELFGGDIGMPYARANKPARAAAKEFEALNLEYIASFFGDDAQNFSELTSEILEKTAEQSDEALVAKLADYIEVTHYKLYMHRLTDNDVTMAVTAAEKKLALIQDEKTKTTLQKLIEDWVTELRKPQSDLFELDKLAEANAAA